MTRQLQTRPRKVRAGTENLEQILSDLEGLERLQALQMTLTAGLRRQVARLAAHRKNKSTSGSNRKAS